MSRAIVVGAGISGLTAGYRLSQAGFEVRVLEAGKLVGGRMASVEVGGFTMPLGALLLPQSNADVRRLGTELGFGPQLQRFDGTIGLVRNGEIHRMRSDHLGIDGLRTKFLSWSSKLKLLRILGDAIHVTRCLEKGDLGALADLDTETAWEYCDRRLNEELREYIFGATTRGLSKQTSVVEFFITSSGTLGGGFIDHPGEIGFLPDALAAKLDVQLGARVRRVEHVGKGARVSWTSAGVEHSEDVDACVIAVPGSAVPAIYPELHPRAAQLIRERLRYGSTIIVHYGLSRKPAEPAMFYMIPEPEHPGVYMVVFHHHRRPKLTPPGKGHISIHTTHEWCQEHGHLDDEALSEQLAASLVHLVPELADSVELSRVFRWSSSTAMGAPGRCAATVELAELLDRDSCIELAGDYFSLSSVNAALVSGEQAAAKLIARAQAKAA